MLSIVSVHAKSLERYLAYTNKTFFFIIGIFWGQIHENKLFAYRNVYPHASKI